jgi:hypothetical protein
MPQGNQGARHLAEERGSRDVEPVEPPEETETLAAMAPIWITARMDAATTAWIASRWRLYGDLD